MHPVQKHLFETGFSGLDGTEFEGTIALSDELINMGLMEALAQLKAATASTSAETAPAGSAEAPPVGGSGPKLDQKAVLAKLDIERLRYRTEAGKTLLDVKASFGKSE